VSRVDGYRQETYGDAFADVYDEWLTVSAGAEDPASSFLAELAGGGGSALELGVGTGRIALPLAARGVAVHGVDASPAMLDRLRAKPGGTELPVTLGDMAEVPVPGAFDVVYVVASTFYCLSNQDTQVHCVQNAVARLKPGGSFVVEAFVPDPTRFNRHQRVEARALDLDQVRLDVARHDPVSQTVISQQVLIGATGMRLYPTVVRYVWPAELDLMCRLAGLRLAGRYGGWHREPFTAASPTHVSVYRRDV
jgi:SAM-dependent methyltransferase